MRVIVNNRLFTEEKDSITNHLGKNPKNGGRPPRDRKLIIKKMRKFFGRVDLRREN
jgi:hypothetical protein